MTMKHPTNTVFVSARHYITSILGAGIFSTALIVVTPTLAQLPAGTSDATQPQTQKSDPLLDQANEALSKHDYPAALKLLTTLAGKNPNNAQILYNLAFTQDALAETPAQTTAAETTYRRAI